MAKPIVISFKRRLGEGSEPEPVEPSDGSEGSQGEQKAKAARTRLARGLWERVERLKDQLENWLEVETAHLALAAEAAVETGSQARDEARMGVMGVWLQRHLRCGRGWRPTRRLYPSSRVS
ncbi:unnamed protein product [Symbiodinium natans]|uniref:Uncharacterized protein n=1 Tax=Symbiodinium natans TaxID=878477 RepID=A0A812IF95_9DINO|nr:unnamed protein product [Symbiodinium natans]